MAALRDSLLRIESGIWFFTKRFGFGFGFVVISSLSGSACCLILSMA